VDESIDLERALSQLPERFRSPVLLTKLHGLSVAECSAVLGIGVANVKQRVFRGLQLLRLAYGTSGSRLAEPRASSSHTGGSRTTGGPTGGTVQ
jgi:DNA-directed RNA polymerase specialized sigma24 family protein